jgi:hypothetical protein
LEYDKNTHEWKVKNDSSSQASANFLGLIKGSGGGTNSYSDEGLKEALRVRGIHAEFEGERWIAKTIELERINVSAFADNKLAIARQRTLGSAKEMPGLKTQMKLNTKDLNLPTDHDVKDERTCPQ